MKRTIERNMFYGASPEIFARAERLRLNMTVAEKHLWNFLNKNQIQGYRFKSQHPISQFIVDFYCHKARLVIELDGGIHNELKIKERDENREYELKQLGLEVIRFTNEEVLTNMQYVLCEIKNKIKL